MNLNLKNKKVLITGASSGIGLAIAEEFLKEDAITCLTSRGSSELIENVSRLEQIYGKSKVFSERCFQSILVHF